MILTSSRLPCTGAPKGARGELFDAGVDAFDLFWQGLNWVDQAEIVGLGALQGAADFLSAGTVQEIADLVGGIALGIQASEFFSDVIAGYADYGSA